jgi:CheY-like chemotaxis protein
MTSCDIQTVFRETRKVQTMQNESSPTPRKIKVLLADDHAAFRRVLRSILPQNETEVIECEDGYEAMRRYADFRPDWVLMDIDMAPMDGLTATDALINLFPKARIVLITSHRGEDLREAAKQAGAFDYVNKENLFEAWNIIRRNTPSLSPA